MCLSAQFLLTCVHEIMGLSSLSLRSVSKLYLLQNLLMPWSTGLSFDPASLSCSQKTAILAVPFLTCNSFTFNWNSRVI